MDRRVTYPQEFRFLTFPPPAGFVFVRGDFISIERSNQAFFVCDTSPRRLREYNRQTGHNFYFDLTNKLSNNNAGDDDDDDAPRTRPHLFNYAYFSCLMVRWSRYNFTFDVDALDLGLEELFAHRYYPERTWAKVHLKFQHAVLVNITVTLKDLDAHEEPLVLTHPQPLDLVEGGLPTAEQALARFMPQFNRWRAYGTYMIFKYPFAEGALPRFHASVVASKQVHRDETASVTLKCVTDDDAEMIESERRRYADEMTTLGLRWTMRTVPRGFYPTPQSVSDGTFFDARDTNENRAHAWLDKISDLVVALLPVRLPIYVMLWLFEFAYPDTCCLPEVRRLRHIQTMWNNYERVLAARRCSPSSSASSPVVKRIRRVTPPPPPPAAASDNLVSPETC